MNLREISDLTRKLSELLKKDLHKAQEAKLAGDYESSCKDANNRLIQCNRMLEEGNMPGAVQLANVNPPLMELIRALTWEDAGIWREHCNTKKLPSPPAFDGPAIKSLTQALVNEDTIGPEHPLSKDFASLMMKKQQEEAYRVLCVILEKDPNNHYATSIKLKLDAGNSFTIPANYYLFFGDNTANSADSRSWGALPKTNVIGHSSFVYWPPLSPRFGWSHR